MRATHYYKRLIDLGFSVVGQENHKPVFQKEDVKIIFCGGCGWIKHNDKIYRFRDGSANEFLKQFETHAASI